MGTLPEAVMGQRVALRVKYPQGRCKPVLQSTFLIWKDVGPPFFAVKLDLKVLQ